jgi:hypothetical protein
MSLDDYLLANLRGAQALYCENPDEYWRTAWRRAE